MHFCTKCNNMYYISISEDDFSCSVSTNVADVKVFFRKRNTRDCNIVFCTYQSAGIVAKSMPKEFRFNLGIFDEAHKTAGDKNKHFGLGLNDSNIKIDFRLFMTATPKHYRVRKKDSIDNRELAYSMDDTGIYGDVCYTFSFAEAVKEKIKEAQLTILQLKQFNKVEIIADVDPY